MVKPSTVASSILVFCRIPECRYVVEVVDTLKTLPEFASVEAMQKKKRDEVGGFAKRLILKGEKG